ncbi:TIGR00269 family protein [Candidatus Pacearchaeota archaeon]|nr:TIGR00269 family protein [Candidatus Pacearchaeota archaeon]
MKIEQKVKQTLKKIKLNKKEKIIVALSGGKDSTVTAYLLKKLGYNIEGFHINLRIGKYSEDCLEAIEKLCKDLKIKLHVYDMKNEMGSGMCYLRTSIQSSPGKGRLKNCAICGVIKKWILNREVRKLKADKIATGHNLDDEAQTFLMNIFKGSPKLSVNSGPITLNMHDEKFIPRIKPLFYVAENDIREYSKKNKLPVNYGACPCALDSYRIQVRKFLDTLSKKDKENIVKNFDKLLKKISKSKDDKITYCEMCGEPSRNNICKKCELMKIV